jgi:hypothetical protein
LLMEEKANQEKLKLEIEQGNFERAVLIALSMDLKSEEVTEFKLKALWQMTAVNRNAVGAKKLAHDFGISREELKVFLEKKTDEQRHEGNERLLMPRYDQQSGKYLDFAEWMENLFKSWSKL